MKKEDGKFRHDGYSETAATVGRPLFPTSGEQVYRVSTTHGTVDVTATTGDEAAAKALDDRPGAKVSTVVPAPQKVQKAQEAA